MTYSKRAMQPLIDKYQINPETNKLFINVVEMFDGQPNYQLWAVKVIFSQAITFEKLQEINAWIGENSTAIKSLSKQNIVGYKTKGDFSLLFREMSGINKIKLIKHVISEFNTAQRDILNKEIFGSSSTKITPIDANSSPLINFWEKNLKGFSMMPKYKRDNLIKVVSTMNNIEDLKIAIKKCLDTSYDWNREDMLAFAENHCKKGYEVIFDNGKQVILSIKNYETSNKLCGQGRTCWCITKSNSYFSDYAGDEGRTQYFYFDFTRKETDCFAHVGFTMENGFGVRYAQTCDNHDMLRGYEQGHERVGIKDIFKKIGVDTSFFMRLKSDPSFKWSVKGLLEVCKENKGSFAVSYESNNKVIVNVINTEYIDKLIGHTFIRLNHVGRNGKVYILFDFSKEPSESKSIVLTQYDSDPYGSLSQINTYDAFNTNISEEKYFESIGIKESDFLNNEKIDPSVLLHKYIDNDDEKSAIKLIEEEGDNIDINFTFQNRVPVCSAIAHNMIDLFGKIVNMKGFKSDVKDGFGETILGSLLYLYASGEVDITEKEEETVEKLIKFLVNSKYVDLNTKNINGDTAINLASEWPKALWVVKLLASNKNVDPNAINDIGYTSVGNAIRRNNLEALKVLGQRLDLKISVDDEKEAKKHGINLSDYIKPNKDFFNKVEAREDVMSMALA